MNRFAWCWVALLASTPVLAQEKAVSFKVAKDHIDFMIGDELATRYHTAGYAKPIFWPLLAPGNVPLTRDWPMKKEVGPNNTVDHHHQKSAWFCHGDIIPEGLEVKAKIRGIDGVDFWSENVGHGKIVTNKVGEPKTDKNHGSFVTTNEWQMNDGTKVLDETRTISFYNFGKARLIVLETDMVASVVPLTFGDTKEGSMAIRINDAILEKAGKIVGKGVLQNAEGKKTEKECWGQKSDWCDYSGPIDGKTVGLTVFADPSNKYPCYWHARGYGLLAANPFGRKKAAFPAAKGNTELVRLAKGEHLVFRFGLLAHEGDANSGMVAEYFQRFVALRDKK